ncbi:MAG TPA: alpha-amylase family glycosyl hydrolase [Candidatus Limnocylindrales bacterium]|nr:alpha-amylase family glycosyl hydrolase [Candidatus Limnocylindrales bacterium]
MADGDWWRHGVIYQIYPRSFQDSDGDGVGDLPGIIARLDHLNGAPDSLGVDAIWLSPFYPSPMADFGYDISDYCDVHPMFGTLVDFDRLLAEAHARGIRVIIDLVPNHTSDQHPWFLESRSSRSSPKRDWYVWADPKPDGSPPNAWQSVFQRVQESAWTFDQRTGQYYLHSFLPQQPDLNWWHPEVRRAMDRVVRFWLERGVDGFRIDVATKTVKVRDLEHPTLEFAPGQPDPTPPADEAEVHALLRTLRATLEEYGERMAVGEVFVLDPAMMARYYGEQADELHLAFNFHFLRQPWDADGFRAAVEAFERVLPPGAWPDYTLSNHDNPRHASRYDQGGRGPARARVAAMMLLTLRGTPFLYYGEEIGMTDVPIPPERVVDVDGRDPERTPMQWDASPCGGFTVGEPWLPMGDVANINVAAQRGDPASLFSLYRRLIALRRESGALRWGRYRSLASPGGVFAYARQAEGETLLVALNMGDDRDRVDLGVAGRGSVVLGTSIERDGEAVDLRSVALARDEGVIVRPEASASD